MLEITIVDDTVDVFDTYGERPIGTVAQSVKFKEYDAVDEARKASWRGNGTWKALRRDPLPEFHINPFPVITRSIRGHYALLTR